jgi:hypothetical protein
MCCGFFLPTQRGRSSRVVYSSQPRAGSVFVNARVLCFWMVTGVLLRWELAGFHHVFARITSSFSTGCPYCSHYKNLYLIQLSNLLSILSLRHLSHHYVGREREEGESAYNSRHSDLEHSSNRVSLSLYTHLHIRLFAKE